ncbi:MAG: chemotaxis protein CheW [Shimia sp.]
MMELLTFSLDGEAYGIDVMAVREIRSWSRPTPLPRTAAHVCGVINLRGTVLPVVDLGLHLGLPEREATDRSVIVVIEDSGQLVGLLTDAVSDIVALDPATLSDPPDMGHGPGSSGIRALHVTDEGMIRILHTRGLLDHAPAAA